MDKEDKNEFTKLAMRFANLQYVSKKNLLRQNNITEDLIEAALIKNIIEVDHKDNYDIYYRLTSNGKKL